MPVRYGPGMGDSPHLISSGGNIYSMATSAVKTGAATRGRGFWVGRQRKDQVNPDVDSPKEASAQHLIGNEDTSDDGFDDNRDPITTLYRPTNLKLMVQRQVKEARQFVDAAAGRQMKKARFILGGGPMDMLLANPDTLNEEQLIKSAEHLRMLADTPLLDGERRLLELHAARVAQALRRSLAAREQIEKAVPKPKEEKEEVKKTPEPKKSRSQHVNALGKVAYDYPKKQGGKGPVQRAKRAQAKGQKGQEQAEVPQQEPEPITPAPQVDPAPFCKLLGIAPEQLQKFAHRKTRVQFVDFFMGQDKLIQKHNISAAMLASVYDSLTAPQAPPAEPQPPLAQRGSPRAASAMPTGAAQQAQKSYVMFHAAAFSGAPKPLIKLLLAKSVDSVAGVRECLQQHFNCSESAAQQLTDTLMNRWEKAGLISYANQ